MTTRPPAWAAALRDVAGGEGDGREAVVGAVARHLAAGAVPAVRDWVGDRWPAVVALPPGLLDALAGRDDPDGPEALGLAHEALAGHDERRRGVHYTPAPLARRLAAVGLGAVARGRGAAADGPPTVCDPACGGGAFLLAAARALADQGHARADVVTALAGLDLDPLAARVAATAGVLWAGAAGVDAGVEPAVTAGDALVGGPWPARPVAGFDLVLGNPPFQGQLGADTARTAAEGVRLRGSLGPAATGYVDTAALFLLAAVDQVRPDGVVLLIQPQSVLASRDAAGVRGALAEGATLAGLWVCDVPVCAARTRVCAPVLRRGPAAAAAPAAAADPGAVVHRWRGPDVTPAPAVEVADPPPSWASLAAGLRDVPAVDLPGAPLVEAGAASAGFRDQFYGLAPFVRDATGAPGEHPLITTGLIDPAGCRWGHRTARYAKARWSAPVVDLVALQAAAPGLARWVQERLVPKVLVATQTRVVEAVADLEGGWVPSTPVVAVPAPPERLWHVLAALLAPPVSAWALHETAGTALAPDALKLSAAQVRRVPAPVDHAAWDDGAAAAREAQEAQARGAAGDRATALAALGAAMVAAHGLDGAEGDRLLAWWWARLPHDEAARADNGPVGQ